MLAGVLLTYSTMTICSYQMGEMAGPTEKQTRNIFIKDNQRSLMMVDDYLKISSNSKLIMCTHVCSLCD